MPAQEIFQLVYTELLISYADGGSSRGLPTINIVLFFLCVEIPNLSVWGGLDYYPYCHSVQSVQLLELLIDQSFSESFPFI